MANHSKNDKGKTYEKENPNEDKMNDIREHIPNAHVVNAIATIALVIATAGVVGVGIWGVIVTKNALELSERAWIAAINAVPSASLEKDKGIHFAIWAINTGREPATDVNYKILNSTIDSYNPEFTEMNTVEVPKNIACVGLNPQKGRAVLPPTQVGNPLQLNLDSSTGDPPFRVDDRVTNGVKFYVVRGCVAYNTFEKVRRTAFCYVMESRLINNTRVFNFNPCATGFDVE